MRVAKANDYVSVIEVDVVIKLGNFENTLVTPSGFNNVREYIEHNHKQYMQEITETLLTCFQYETQDGGVDCPVPIYKKSWGNSYTIIPTNRETGEPMTGLVFGVEFGTAYEITENTQLKVAFDRDRLEIVATIKDVTLYISDTYSVYNYWDEMFYGEGYDKKVYLKEGSTVITKLDYSFREGNIEDNRYILETIEYYNSLGYSINDRINFPLRNGTYAIALGGKINAKKLDSSKILNNEDYSVATFLKESVH